MGEVAPADPSWGWNGVPPREGPMTTHTHLPGPEYLASHPHTLDWIIILAAALVGLLLWVGF